MGHNALPAVSPFVLEAASGSLKWGAPLLYALALYIRGPDTYPLSNAVRSMIPRQMAPPNVRQFTLRDRQHRAKGQAGAEYEIGSKLAISRPSRLR